MGLTAPALTQQTSTVTPQPDASQTPIAATEQGSTRGYDPVMATFAAAFNPLAETKPTPTPVSYTRGYDPLFMTMQAWANRQTATEPAQMPTAMTYTRGYDPLFMTMQAWADRQTATEAPCAWMWANAPLVEQTEIVQAALNAAGATRVTFEASTFGENCIDGATGELRSFYGRDVVFRLTVSGGDAAALGDMLARGLPVVQQAIQSLTQPLEDITIVFTDADLDPIRLTTQGLDRVLEFDANGNALIARLYSVSLR
jgi:hypothetical protein